MESFGQYHYETDLSLFGGDLLVGLPPASAELGSQDGLKSKLQEVARWQPINQLDQGLLDSGQSGDLDLVDPFSENWLDTKVDLVDYLTHDGPQVDPVQTAPSEATKIKSLHPAREDTEPSILTVEMLKSIAEETALLLEEEPHQDHHDSGVMDTSGSSLLEMLAENMDATLDELADSPVLSPMTAEDIESILSSEPPSPSDLYPTPSVSPHSPDPVSLGIDEGVLTGDLAQLLSAVENHQYDDNEESQEDPDWLPESFHVNTSRPKPYERNTTKRKAESSNTRKDTREAKQAERKLRKKQQNKDAATRYRQKKKAESEAIDKECEDLESRNNALKDQVEQMTREIKYLKSLMAEVYKAKGQKSHRIK